MIDKSVAYKSIIMGCDKINTFAYKEIPSSFSIKYYTYGDEKHWVNIHESIVEFKGYSTNHINNYFRKKFMIDITNLKRRCIFLAEKSTGIYVGSCMAWYGKKDDIMIPVLHWLAIRDEYENQGFVRVLLTETMKIFDKLYFELKRIYLHTQPSAYRAIKLYHDFGFCMLKKDKYGKAKNEYDEAMLEIKEYLSQPYILN